MTSRSEISLHQSKGQEGKGAFLFLVSHNLFSAPWSGPEKAHGPEQATSSSSSSDPQSSRGTDRIRQNIAYLLDNLDPSIILEDLLESGVIDTDCYLELTYQQSGKGRRFAAKYLIQQLLRKSSDVAGAFVVCLRKNKDTESIAERLEQPHHAKQSQPPACSSQAGVQEMQPQAAPQAAPSELSTGTSKTTQDREGEKIHRLYIEIQ